MKKYLLSLILILLFPLFIKADDTQLNSAAYLKNNYNFQVNGDKDWAAIALGAIGEEVGIDSQSESNVLSLSRKALALAAQGKDNSSQIEKILSQFQNNQFGDPNLINDDIFAILAIQSNSNSWAKNHSEVFGSIIASQHSDGSFGYSKTSQSDIDMTSAAIWALSFGGNNTEIVINKAWDFISKAQNTDGGYGYVSGQPSNICSSSWAAIGGNKLGKDNQKVFSFLIKNQTSDGSWKEGEETSYKATAYATLALSKKTLPIFYTQKDTNTTPVNNNPVIIPSINKENNTLPPAILNQTTPSKVQDQPQNSELAKNDSPLESNKNNSTLKNAPIKKSAKKQRANSVKETTNTSQPLEEPKEVTPMPQPIVQPSCYATASANSKVENGHAEASSSASVICQ